MFLSRVTDIIDDAVISVPGELTLTELHAILGDSGHMALPVAIIRQDGSLDGVIGHMAFDPHMAHARISELTVKPSLRVSPEASAFELVAHMLAKGLDFAAVMSGELFRGLVTRRSVTRAFGEMSAV